MLSLVTGCLHMKEAACKIPELQIEEAQKTFEAHNCEKRHRYRKLKGMHSKGTSWNKQLLGMPRRKGH